VSYEKPKQQTLGSLPVCVAHQIQKVQEQKLNQL
jgi:hypothetical protein